VIGRRKRRRRLFAVSAFLAVVGAATIGYIASQLTSRGAAITRVGPIPPTTTLSPSSQKTRVRRASTTVEHPASGGHAQKAGLFTPADRASFASLEVTLGGTSGLAASPVGFSQPVSELGTLHEGVAWSTIKVPIAVAVEARSGGHPTASTQALLIRAITASDNAAAEELWSSLGPPDAAGVAAQNVLAAGGDATTRVETRVLRAEFTSFGQTEWSLAAQERFVAGLPCLPNSAPVLSLMNQVEADQRWGLGSLGAETEFKGGWGPDPRGRYLVRQMGIVRLPNGRPLAVSIATMPADGSFASGTANLGEIARWLMAHVDASQVPPSRC
jgi:hypothetical protein